LAINKALVVDNSKTSQAILGQIFSVNDIEVDVVGDTENAFAQLNKQDIPYSLIVVSSSLLKDEPEYFALKLRTEKNYAHTPLVLLTTRSTEFDRSYYAVGYTQIFTRTEIGKFKNYVEQVLCRSTYAKNNENKVIIIEDDLSQQLVLKAILESNFCECTCYNAAEEALKHAGDAEADVIIVDFFLNGKMTGMEFISEVRNLDHPWKRIPILATTALDDPARKYEFLRAGANDYLVKPIETLDVTVRVENMIKYKRLVDTVEAQREEMHYLAMHDQLTGLYNRHYMVSQVGGRIKEAQRHRIPYSIIVLDIDHFKSVNDTWGHDKGDQVLKAIADILKTHSRTEDIVARLGGEEFILLLAHCDLMFAVKKAEELRAKIESAKPVGLALTASFGVAELSQALNNFDSLFKAADNAVYQAKHDGRNRVQTAQ
jgi:diguanylate cyclase (GGDEF) domain